MYFNKIPTIYYDFDIAGEETLKVVRDITYNIRLRSAILENITLFDEYDIQDGETPDIIAAKVYGSSEYHWVIMLCNQRFNYTEDFPIPEQALSNYVAAKYENPDATHHYEKDGFIVTPNTIGSYPVSNFQYEQALNESKRRIKLISPQLLGKVINDFKLV